MSIRTGYNTGIVPGQATMSAKTLLLAFLAQ